MTMTPASRTFFHQVPPIAASLWLLLALCLPTLPLSAQTITWANPGVGDFDTGSNWVGGFVPQSFNSILIDNGGTAQSSETLNITDATLSNNSTLQLLPGLLSYMASDEIYLGASGIGRLVIGSQAEAATGDVYAGSGVGGTGIISLDGGTLSPFAFYAGYAGQAEVSLTNGASILSTRGRVGFLPGSQGIVTLNNSTWTISDGGQPENLTVGVQGQGQIEATNSQFSALNLSIGESSGSSGNFSLNGGNLTIQNNIYVGNMTTGSLSLAGGAHTNPYQLSVGNQSGSSGSVSMNGSSASVTENILIGFDGNGTLTMSNSTLAAKALFLARNPGSVGTGSISGGNLTLTEDLHVGSGGSGNFSLTGGAMLHTDVTNLAFETGSTGVMSVGGSTWENTRAIFVGVSGNGTLDIGPGGLVESESGYLAQRSGGVGTVNVNGGSWIMGNTLAVGVNGTAQLSISNGGQVSSDWSQIGLNAGSGGSAHLDNGSWTTNQTLVIGGAAAGSLTAVNGSTLSAFNIQLGQVNGIPASLTASNSTISVVSILSTSSNATANLSGVEIQLRGGSSVLDTLLIDGFSPGAFVVGPGGITVNTQGGNAQIPLALDGTGNFTKTGAGRLRLANGNTFPGGTNLSSGVLEIQGNSPLGPGNVAVGSAELRAFTSATLSGNLSGGIQLVSVSANHTGTFSATPGNSLTLAPLDFLLVSGSNLQIGSSGNNGTVVFQPTGAVALPGDVAIDVVAGTFQAGNGGLEFMTAIAESTTVAAGATLDFADHLTTGGIRALFGAGTIQIGNNSTTQLVVDEGNFSGNIAGNGGLVKESNGTLVLSGPTAFIGGTTVNAGTLVVNAPLGFGAGRVTLNPGGTLAGDGLTGTIFLEGGNLSPGSSTGNLTAENLYWDFGTVIIDLGVAPASSVFLDVGGLEGFGSSYEFTFVDGGWSIGTTYSLIGYEMTDIPVGNFTFTNGGGFDGEFFFENDTLKFTLTAVPEPGVMGLALIAGMVLLVRLARRSTLPYKPSLSAESSDPA